MTFRNPWIDPRIARARAEHVQAYLTRHGWQLVGPAADLELLRYERAESEQAPTLFVPVRGTTGAGLEWMIEVVADLARYEGRWAVDVLQDILRQPTAPSPVNGPADTLQAQAAPK